LGVEIKLQARLEKWQGPPLELVQGIGEAPPLENWLGFWEESWRGWALALGYEKVAERAVMCQSSTCWRFPGDCQCGDELSIDGIFSGLINGSGEKVDGMKEAVFVGDFGRFEVVVSKFYCVGDDKSFGVSVHDLEATVVR
jgi:hypothetical protein